MSRAQADAVSAAFTGNPISALHGEYSLYLCKSQMYRKGCKRRGR